MFGAGNTHTRGQDSEAEREKDHLHTGRGKFFYILGIDESGTNGAGECIYTDLLSVGIFLLPGGL